MTQRITWAAAAALLVGVSGTAQAAEQAPVAVAKCQASYGSIAVTDGDTQGWTKFGLGSPREMIAALVRESGCFTIHDASTGKPATFLMSAIAGDKEEVNQGVGMAKTALVEGALRTGVLGQMAARVPFAGAAFGMFNGLGGKKKTVSAGLRVVSPATGQTLISGTGEASKSSLTFGGATAGFAAMAGQYGQSGDGKLLTTAFVTAYNNVVAQAGALPHAQ